MAPCTFLVAVSVSPAQQLPDAPSPGDHTSTPPAGLSAQVTGQVLSEDGSLVSGAHVKLSCAEPPQEQQTSSDAQGNYTFQSVPAGSCSVMVMLPGFNTGKESFTVAANTTVQVPPVRLSMATVNISVNAVTEEQLALEELHREEHQRLVGILPNFFVSYNWTAPPLTSGQKYKLATHTVLDPGNLALVGTVAAVQQADNAFPGYRQGAAGYGKRYGADLANLVVGTYMGGAVLPSLFHQDPRYFYKGTGSIRSRAIYAFSRAVITRGDNGHPQPNFSSVLGDLSAGAISNIYYPASDRQGATLFLENGVLGIAGDAMNDLVQEFVLPHFTTRGSKAAKKQKQP